MTVHIVVLDYGKGIVEVDTVWSGWEMAQRRINHLRDALAYRRDPVSVYTLLRTLDPELVLR